MSTPATRAKTVDCIRWLITTRLLLNVVDHEDPHRLLLAGFAQQKCPPSELIIFPRSNVGKLSYATIDELLPFQGEIWGAK